VRTQKLLLEVMGHKRLLESHDDTMLLQKIQLRAPYVTPLNVLQVPTSPVKHPWLQQHCPSLHIS
jgi:phosphoenolpyruvate carboxylase